MIKRHVLATILALFVTACADVYRPHVSTTYQINDANGVPTWAVIPASYRAEIQWPWVIYNHGYGQRGSDIYTDPKLAVLVESLAAAGYVVVATDYRDSNCWGNSECDADVGNLQNVWRAHLNLKQRPYVMGESMGGIVTWNAIAHGYLRPAAVVGIYPACSLAAMFHIGTLAPSIEAAYDFSSPGQLVPATAGYDPMLDPPSDFAGFPIVMWASRSDSVVVRSKNEDPFAAAINAVGGSVVIHTSKGNHGDASNFDPRAVISFFSQVQP